MKPEQIRRVIVVFKTHLDIGFTGLAADVLRRYREEILPAAIELAKRANTGGEKRFVWTVGSYLIKHCLDHADESTCEKIASAVLCGDIRYHALPFTTHTELMDEALFRYGLGVKKKLDERFGIVTRAAKMTDVPGHTAAMVPILAESGVEYLHIGVNDSSRVPDVPPLFRWRFGGAEIVVNYAGSYGQATLLENGVALQFCHGADNARPPSMEELDTLYEKLQAQYPNAKIAAGTLDDFLPFVREVRSSLPVVEEEIGDTWIHGAATDPYKVSRFCRLLALKEKWLKEGALTIGSPAYETLMENLLLVAEHTWGMDTKKYLLDFTNWQKADFARARKADVTSYALLSPHNKPLFDALLPELQAYRGENERSSYSLFESSHEEQRAYVKNAVSALPKTLFDEAEHRFSFFVPTIGGGKPVYPNEPVRIGETEVILGEHGEIIRLLNEKTCTARKVKLGLFEYQSFDAKTVDACLYDYGRDMDKNWFWAECDFGKPGLKYYENLKDGVWRCRFDRAETNEDTLTVWLLGEREACEQYGCPREVVVTHTLKGNSIDTELFWQGKDAARSPEALWFSFDLGVNGGQWYYEKLGRLVSVDRVVRGGNRSLACAKRVVWRDEGGGGAAELISFDAPVASASEKSLYRVDDKLVGGSGGFYFLLFNNRWGTNFKQWFEEDMHFAFSSLF